MKPMPVNIPDYLRKKMKARKDKTEIPMAAQIRTALHEYFKRMEAKE